MAPEDAELEDAELEDVELEDVELEDMELEAPDLEDMDEIPAGGLSGRPWPMSSAANGG
jgi:hypothetical protein